MKKYENPVAQIIYISTSDVITISFVKGEGTAQKILSMSDELDV